MHREYNSSEYIWIILPDKFSKSLKFNLLGTQVGNDRDRYQILLVGGCPRHRGPIVSYGSVSYIL